MISYPSNSLLLCLSLTAGAKPCKDVNGRVIEEIKEETMLDRIFARSNENIYLPSGIYPAKCLQVIEYKYDNPYVLLIAKVVTPEEADIIIASENKNWNEYIRCAKDNIVETLKKLKKT